MSPFLQLGGGDAQAPRTESRSTRNCVVQRGLLRQKDIEVCQHRSSFLARPVPRASGQDAGMVGLGSQSIASVVDCIQA